MTVSVTALVVVALAVLAVGGVLGWVLASSRERVRTAAAESRAEAAAQRRAELEAEVARLAEDRSQLERKVAGTEADVRNAREQVEAQKAFIEASRKQLEDAFKALASDALEGSSRQFLKLAEQRWQTTREEAAGDLEKRKAAIEGLLKPLEQTLKNLDEKTGSIEKERRGAYDALKEHLTLLHGATSSLQDKTATLASALRGTQVRGRWGEIALRNIAELAGMSEHCDFVEQATVGDGKRPDMVVKLPEGRLIAIDSKVPLAGYLKAVEAVDDAARDAGLREHVQAVRAHIRALAARDYAADLEGDIDLVVLFLPGDAFLAAAFGEDPDLQVEALRSRVLVATPTTLVALLRTVAIYHQQRALADNAREIADTARELYDRAAKIGEDLGRAGRGLTTAVKAFNDAVGSYERRFLPMGQKLEDLKVTEQSRRRLEVPEPVALAPRITGGAGDDDASLNDDG
ncbi:MAG TPA: DNA recombination protein RmuC [Candidatus Sulfomarinibacteraceae bacterium]|nr:DNA recombination protein RmuC [Candidatus Sulfomarinibacteraceae bacterium]